MFHQLMLMQNCFFDHLLFKLIELENVFKLPKANVLKPIMFDNKACSIDLT